MPQAEKAENLPLFLPSALPQSVRSTPEMSRVCNMEIRLRKAAASDSLSEVRRGRRNITKLWKYKKVNVSGTGNRPNTRMLTLYTRLNNKIERGAERYRRARAALVILDPNGAWKEEFKELRKDDVRGPGKDSDERSLDEVLQAALGTEIDTTSKAKAKPSRSQQKSNGRFEESWIWLVQRKGKAGKNEEDEFGDDIRVEWAKSRARSLRWKEEFLLVKEEMRRVIEWYEWKAAWWEKKASERVNGDPDILDGVIAYSHKQAHIVRQMAQRCAEIWIPVLKTYGETPDWTSRYPTTSSEKKKRRQSTKGMAHDQAHKDGDGDLSDGNGTEDDDESEAESDGDVVEVDDDDFVYDD